MKFRNLFLLDFAQSLPGRMNPGFVTVGLLLLFILMTNACLSTQSGQNKSRLAQAVRTEGEALMAQGNHTAALAKLLEAKEMIPEDPFVHNSLGLAYMGKKRDDLAEQAFQKALHLKTDYTEARNNLGAALLRQDKLDLAIQVFLKVLDDLLYPTPHFPLSNLGWAYIGKKEFQKAETYFMKAMDSQPWYIPATHGQAKVFLETNRPDDAIAFLKTGLYKHPDAAILHADMAQAYEVRKEFSLARRAWQQVLRLSPANSPLSLAAEKKLSGN